MLPVFVCVVADAFPAVVFYAFVAFFVFDFIEISSFGRVFILGLEELLSIIVLPVSFHFFPH